MPKKIDVPPPQLTEHPLMGVRFNNLFNLLSGQKKIPPSKWPHLFAFGASALARAPFSMIERWMVSRNKAVEKLEPPIFIVGFWRSGTTHFHNLLGQSPELGIITPVGSGLPDELLTLGTWFKSLLRMGLPEDRGIDQVAVTPQSPQEDEIPIANLQPLSIFQAFYFPAKFRENFNRGVFFDSATPAEVKRWKAQMLYFFQKVAIHQGKQPLLIKNPVYMARVNLLLDIWPEARFIHIYRNPYRVYRSNMQYYPKMINELGLQPYNKADIEPTVLNAYPRMMEKLYDDVKHLPDSQFMEVRYEEVDENPLNVLERVYAQLNLPAWPTAKYYTEAYLKSIADYSKNSYNQSLEDYEKVDKYWGKYVQQWGYGAPEVV
jgi:hypothetical protein